MIIDASVKIDDLDLVKHLKNLDSPFVNTIREVYEEIKELLNTRIQYVFPNYTLHNSGHSFRIIQYMAKIVGNYENLSELEIALLVLSALLHDVGMAVSEEDIKLIKSDNFKFCDTKFSSLQKIVSDPELVLQEYVRRIHASLSSRYIKNNLSDKLRIPNLSSLNFVNELALICESHTQGVDWLKRNLRANEIKGSYYFNPQFIACILRLADILDIDSNRTPYNLYKMIAPVGISDSEWRQHFIISNDNKIEYDQKTNLKKVVFHGKATNASTHRKLLSYIGWVKLELTNVVALANGMSTQYNLIYDVNPEVNIQTEGYTFSDYKMTLNFKAISSLLMGENIYGSKELGLRELIQNSIDSCRIRHEAELAIAEFGTDGYRPKVKVVIDKEKNEVVIKDNGTGMTLDIVKNHFLNIGVSYYNSDSFLLKDFDYKPIGNFGIGFLACFMLSRNIKVITRHYQSINKYTIELEQGNEWTSLTESEDVVFEGTEVSLEYNHFVEAFANDESKILEFLKAHFLTDGIELEIINRFNKSIDSVSNNIINNKPLGAGLLRIDLSKYIHNATGFAVIKRNQGFISSFDDITFQGTLHLYTPEDGLIQIENLDELLLSDYIANGKISYYNIPLVSNRNEDDFLSGLKFTSDDTNDVIERMDRELDWISVLVTARYQNGMGDQDIEYYTTIINGLSHDDLVSIGHSSHCKTRAFAMSLNVYEHIKNDMYIDFGPAIKNVFRYLTNSKKEELFIRGVLLKDFAFKVPILASAFTIDSIRINLESRRFIPNISRNDVDSATRADIGYIVGKAIHLGAIDLLELTYLQKQALADFTKHFYPVKTLHEM
ncbi:hypothetical protein GCM10027422_28580 [Hymenobacter arcticus]